MAPEPAQAIKVTSRMREAAQLMNRIPPGKFPLLLSRILSKVHIKNAQIFTADEEVRRLHIIQLIAPSVANA